MLLSQLLDGVLPIEDREIAGITCDSRRVERGFAFVSFNPCRKAKERPETWMTVTFGLSCCQESPRIDVTTEPYPGRWTHHVMVGSPKKLTKNL